MGKTVEIMETGLVTPSDDTPKHEIWLSNLDLLVARGHTPTVYFYRPNGDPNFFSVETLKAALGKALVPFYPLAGRFVVDPEGRVEIQCTGEGVLFVVGRSDSTVDEFGDFAPSTEMRQLLVPSVESGNPPCILVMFQVTFFKCGGVCLGAAVHHPAADGLGALHFVNSWAEIARGMDLAVLPYLDRTLLRARSPPTVLFDHVEYSQKPQAKPSSGSKYPFDSAILKLSKNQLHSLKNIGSGKKPLSTFKAVVAHVWRCACKARQLSSEQETRLYMTADARARVKPPLPQGYLGNAIFRTSGVATVGEVLSNSLEFSADKVHGAIVRLNDEFIRSLVDYLEQLEDVRGLHKGAWVMPGTDLWVISWLGLPIYEADFGWGKPVFMGRACLQFSGLVYIMNNPGDDGSLSLAVALEPENMPRLKKIFYEELEAVGGA
ncbi:putrescine hydroxycinnamoyltransferase 1 [Cocos nucifera]|uniref:Putrescine hydroxycinnamoyltransferase 1 n=1 Tax=Cocos nucifera TaxID=13894 RepID=A0A8K0MUK7_COCNU|nr:putrescine hydroxycinnamoyltransferase 1 [Cocos nucifera]